MTLEILHHAYHWAERFHLFAGMPFLCKELWHFANHALKQYMRRAK